MKNSNERQTFGELCEEFDIQNKKDPIYSLVMRFVIRFISSGPETRMDYFLKQLCTKKGNIYKISDSDCLEFIHLNKGTLGDIDGKIKTFEEKLSFFLD